MLLSHSRDWPWGLVVCGDPDDREPVPTQFGDARAVSTRGTIVALIQHAVDGEATATVALGAVPSELAVVHTTSLTVTSGRLLLTDAGREQQQECSVPPGKYRVSVHADGSGHPAAVHFSLEGPATYLAVGGTGRSAYLLRGARQRRRRSAAAEASLWR
jgi:hypothetical protein